MNKTKSKNNENEDDEFSYNDINKKIICIKKDILLANVLSDIPGKKTSSFFDKNQKILLKIKEIEELLTDS